MHPLPLPRSVVAALWLPHVRDLGAVSRAAEAVTGDDEPHVARVGRAQLNLPALFARWAPVRVVGAALPVPGDPAGAPAAVAAAALDAGECLVVAGREGAAVAVPRVRVFGSRLEPGRSVTWEIHEVDGADLTLLSAAAAVSEARLALTEATLGAIDTLTRLDLARWEPEIAERLAGLASSDEPEWPLPAEVGPERTQLLARAARLLAVVRLASGREGAAVTARDSDARVAALREVATTARRALSAASVFVR